MKRFEYFEPGTLEEASALLAGGGQALAGGTDLLVELREHLREARRVVNIKKIGGLDELAYGKEGLRIGALVTAREIEISPVVAEFYASLRQAVRELGSIQVRNRATVVGNICRASPSADTIPPLVADGASVEINGARVVPLEVFFTGPGKTVLKPGELVTAIVVPRPPAGTRKVYIKHGRRKAMELATVGVAVTRTPDETRIALGAVAPTVIRARAAEQILQKNSSLLEEAAVAAMAEAKPISNVRASAEYRREMVRVLVKRALS
jgi:CO/xanthine dehydrogenase FAD-binding subunit